MNKKEEYEIVSTALEELKGQRKELLDYVRGTDFGSDTDCVERNMLAILNNMDTLIRTIRGVGYEE